ncbi:MAG: hypothetical protein QOG33_1780 [Gaiellales bacterium]|jgi:hypothetical protein|nr:hypothetical protein [Gaiellales bacterium]
MATDPTAAEAAARYARFFDLVWGLMGTRCLHVAAELGIADRLVDGPRPVAEVADEVGADRDALVRIIRALVAMDVFTAPGPGVVGLGPLGELLVSGRPGSMRDMALFWGGEVYDAWGDMLHAARTGSPAFDHVFGQPHFDWLSHHPEQARVFDGAMAGGAAARLPPLLARDWSPVGTVVDVGGGNGSILRALLTANSHLRGTLFDLPHVVEAAGSAIDAQGLSDRCGTVAGSFFEHVPGGGDVYLLAQILHDWDDDDALRILSSVRAAIPPTGLLLVVELIVPDDDRPHPSKLLDLQMLVLLGGRERTLEQWRQLLRASGFALGDISEGARSCVLEARPVTSS